MLKLNVQFIPNDLDKALIWHSVPHLQNVQKAGKNFKHVYLYACVYILTFITQQDWFWNIVDILQYAERIIQGMKEIHGTCIQTIHITTPLLFDYFISHSNLTATIFQIYVQSQMYSIFSIAITESLETNAKGLFKAPNPANI